MQYILNETEYQSYLANKKAVEDLLSANARFVEQVSLLENQRRSDREQIERLRETCKSLCEKRDVLEGLRLQNAKELRDKAHELLVKEAELAELSSKFRRVLHEHVCIATSATGLVKVISVTKREAYLQHGWKVSEELLVDRPA